MDARRFPRHRRRVRVRYSSEGKRTWKSAVSADVGAGGLFIVTNASVRRGHAIDLELELPNGRINATGRVTWCKRVHPNLRDVMRGGFGVELEQAGEDWYRFCITLEGSTLPPPRRLAPEREDRPEPSPTSFCTKPSGAGRIDRIPDRIPDVALVRVDDRESHAHLVDDLTL